MKRFIVAIDGTDGSDAAVDEALALAAGLEAELTFVHVRKPTPGVLGHPYYDRWLSTGLNEARTTVAEAVHRAEKAGVAADGEIIEGDPADEIVSLADNRGADLIVVGSRGHGALAGALLGSVSRAVVRHANVPVLVAKHAAARHQKVA